MTIKAPRMRKSAKPRRPITIHELRVSTLRSIEEPCESSLNAAATATSSSEAVAVVVSRTTVEGPDVSSTVDGASEFPMA